MEDYPQLMLYCSFTLIALLNVIAILRLLYKKIGALLFCNYFKNKNPNGLDPDNAYAQARKIIRDSDLKGYDDTDLNDGA